MSDEKFFAWLDGELDAGEAAEMEAKAAADPELARLAEQHSSLGARLKRAFDPIAEAPAPEHLQAMIRPSAEVVDFASTKRARWMPSIPQWTALAATLAAGIFVGSLIPQGGRAPVEVSGAKIYAASALSDALDTQLASSPRGDIRVRLTFRNRSGEICRTFAENAATGLACRSGGRWQVRGLFAAAEGQSTDYRMASGMNPGLAALMGSTIAGEPFDATQEKAARDNGWR